MTTRLRSSDVFINCPFDIAYRPVFNAIVFSVYDLGFVARCALEEDDAGEFRLSKIERIIEECRFGINDLSAVALDAICIELGLEPDRLTFLDLSATITDWLRTNR